MGFRLEAMKRSGITSGCENDRMGWSLYGKSMGRRPGKTAGAGFEPLQRARKVSNRRQRVTSA